MSTFSGFSSSTKIWDTFLAERIAKSWIRRCWCCSSREDLRHYCWTALGFSCLHYLCKILLLQHCNSKSAKLNPKVKELHLLPDYGMVLLCKLEDILSFYCIYRIYYILVWVEVHDCSNWTALVQMPLQQTKLSFLAYCFSSNTFSTN